LSVLKILLDNEKNTETFKGGEGNPLLEVEVMVNQ
jgi:hypothetical protein